MKLGLQLRLKQTLAPQLIQSLKMLQMPLLKLEQKLRMELATNPLLEEIEEVEPETEPTEETEFDVADEKETADPVEWEDLFSDDEGYKVREPREQIEERFESIGLSSESLYDHLNEQLSFLGLGDKDNLIGQYIIGNIGPDGYLAITVPEMAAELGIDAERIDAVLVQIHTFDPTGVGARDLKESLLLQLTEKDLTETLAFRV
ncbi:MAG: RNA polymerase sigma-54 factor, partial [candidate division Zixibacteria bacterium]